MTRSQRPAPATSTKADQAGSNHRLSSQRAIVVYQPDADGEPDLTRPAYALNRVEVAGHRAYLRSNDIAQRQFDVTFVRPVTPALPRWATWLGLRRSQPLLLCSRRVKPGNTRFLQGFNWRLLRFNLIGLGLMWGVVFLFQKPAHAGLSEWLTSRHVMATVVVLGVFFWAEVAAFCRRHFAEPADDVHPNFQYAMRPVPCTFKAGPASLVLKGVRLRVVNVKVGRVVHWLHPGPEIDGSNPRPEVRFRLHAEAGKGEVEAVFEGRTRQGEMHPFILPGDVVRLVEPAESRTQARPGQVLALANLSDGHWSFDNLDERFCLDGLSYLSACSGALLFFMLPMLAISGLFVGAEADEANVALLGLNLFMLACLGGGQLWAWRRRTRLMAALGDASASWQDRAIAVASLPVGYFG